MPLRYFIPDWDDRVDPAYDFATDAHAPGRNPYRDDVYAHEIYTPPPYDGILLSLATLDGNAIKREAIRTAGSVHRYLRLPADGVHEVIGDCGAFTYWQQETPPYSTDQVLDTYQTLGFDLGVSVDHLIFAELEAEKERRWHITVDNAEEFLRLHQNGGYTFTPVGVAQGWDPASYQRSARALVQMGYNYIAVGGLVRSTTNDVLRTLQAVKEALRPGMGVHLFGVNRPEHAATFAQLAVTSFDSASRLRRAWMDGRRNYFLGDVGFTAIRIPDAKTVAKKNGLEVTPTAVLARDALEAVRAYARNEIDSAATLAAIQEYAAVAGDLTPRALADYQITLEARPWEQCPCTICRKIGVEVIIFRGNNRNRRRGFHNTWQLYKQLENLSPAAEPPASPQMEFAL
jgi:hypothetical protein